MYLSMRVSLCAYVLSIAFSTFSLGRSLGASHLGRPTLSMYSDTDYSSTVLTLFAIRSYRDHLVSFSLYLPCISQLRPNAVGIRSLEYRFLRLQRLSFALCTLYQYYPTA
nr:MAG TPA: hypothetical protein [Caudoviricetes sp.]